MNRGLSMDDVNDIEEEFKLLTQMQPPQIGAERELPNVPEDLPSTEKMKVKRRKAESLGK